MRKTSEKALILFDGVCNLCNSAVQRVIKNDRSDHFRFAALQSETGKVMIKKYNITADSIILVEDGKAYSRSSAALRIAKDMDNGFKLLYAFIILPKFIRDYVYDYIAKHRYRWFGKQQQCMLPTPSLQNKFLD